MADEPVRLSPRIEEMLTAFSTPERDWEADASAIEARLKDVSGGSTEARWLEPPLPEEAPKEAVDEASKPAATSTPAAASSPAPKGAPSLADLARSVAAKSSRPQSTDIAKESLSVAAAARSHTDAIVERVRSSRVTPPPAPSQRPAAPSQRSPDSKRAAPRVSQPAPTQPAPTERRSSQALPWIAVGGLGVVAAMLLFDKLKERDAPSAATATPVAAEAAPTPKAAPPSAPSPTTVSPRAELAQRAADDPETTSAAMPGLAASALPLALRGAPPPATPNAANAGPAAPVAQARPAGAPVAGASPARPQPEAVVLEDGPGRAKAGAAAANSGLQPAAGSPVGGLPDRPSTGAVQAAIGSVMGGARSCVVGTTAATPAQVTFGSDGAVKTVSVSGAAAGTPAASCIENALKRARVAPFASPSFSLMVWVRP